MTAEKEDFFELGDLDRIDPHSQSQFEVIEHLDELYSPVAENGNVRKLQELARAYELNRSRSQLIRYLEFAFAFAKEMDDPIVISLIQDALAHLRE